MGFASPTGKSWPAPSLAITLCFLILQNCRAVWFSGTRWHRGSSFPCRVTGAWHSRAHAGQNSPPASGRAGSKGKRKPCTPTPSCSSTLCVGNSLHGPCGVRTRGRRASPYQGTHRASQTPPATYPARVPNWSRFAGVAPLCDFPSPPEVSHPTRDIGVWGSTRPWATPRCRRAAAALPLSLLRLMVHLSPGTWLPSEDAHPRYSRTCDFQLAWGNSF